MAEFRWAFDQSADPADVALQGCVAAKAMIAPICNAAQAALGEATVLNALFTLSIEGALSAGRRDELEHMMRGALAQMDTIEAAFHALRDGAAGRA